MAAARGLAARLSMVESSDRARDEGGVTPDAPGGKGKSFSDVAIFLCSVCVVILAQPARSPAASRQSNAIEVTRIELPPKGASGYPFFNECPREFLERVPAAEQCPRLFSTARPLRQRFQQPSVFSRHAYRSSKWQWRPPIPRLAGPHFAALVQFETWPD